MGQVRVQWLCHLYGSMLLEDQVVPTTEDQGVTNEPISKAITNDMALPISYRLGSKVPIQDTEWCCGSRSEKLYKVLFTPERVQNC